MKITPQDIHNQEFKRSLRGYDMDEVDAFLQQIADELEVLTSENAELKDRVKELTLRMGEFEKKDELLEKTLLAAQQATEQMKEASRKEAEATSTAAKAEAVKIIERARLELITTDRKVQDMKRYHYEFIIEYKALLDRHYRLLSEMVDAAKAEREERTPAAVNEMKTAGKEPEAGVAGGRTADRAKPLLEEPGAPGSEVITVEIENLGGGDKNKAPATGGPRVEVIGKPDGSFDAERAADEVSRRFGGEEEGEPIV